MLKHAQQSLTAASAARRLKLSAPRALVPFTAFGASHKRSNYPREAEWRQWAEPEAASSSSSGSSAAKPADAAPPETVFYEGSGSNVELAISLLLSATLLFLPLTIASIGRRLWIKYRFTNKRVVVITNSPILQREVQVEYRQIKEIRSAPRAFGAWGDIVIFLKDGSRLPIAGLERYQEIVDYMEGFVE